ncbi:MAG: alanine racemase [Oscillospiraceae bacterium]
MNALKNRNEPLLKLAFEWHKQGKLLPDTYLLDLDSIVENARTMKQEADRVGVELFFMTKQLGRNPAVCKKLIGLGYAGAVVVDFREAQVMMKNHIPIAHAGHLVQIPNAGLTELLSYGVGLMTVFSIQKAKRINAICEKLGIVQSIAVKFYGQDDFIYPGQEAGFAVVNLPQVLADLQLLSHIKLTTLTSFPCFLYNEQEKAVKPVTNLTTMQDAKNKAEAILHYTLQLNVPSCTQTELLTQIALQGGQSAEPGSALIGMTPNNRRGEAKEIPSLVYLTEVSHNFKDYGYCFGGGAYCRGVINQALVGKTYDNACLMAVHQRSAENIDYHFELAQHAQIGDAVAMCFRTQIFVTRSQVAVISGLHSGKPVLEGLYSSQGERLSKGDVDCE